VVNFSGIFEALDAAGFDGPCTLEIEGIEGEQRTERLVCDRIAESVGYLRGLGRA
jgi:sugar phosphate isomerase/epimerase